jgi:spore maturation protein CgeB
VADYRVPEVFATAHLTLHIPRRPYVRELPGIPTIRPFEALACGLPLICSPWPDSENLFTAGRDFLVVPNSAEMTEMIHKVLSDPSFAEDLASHGRITISRRHTCAHRVDELFEIYSQVVNESQQVVAAI